MSSIPRTMEYTSIPTRIIFRPNTRHKLEVIQNCTSDQNLVSPSKSFSIGPRLHRTGEAHYLLFLLTFKFLQRKLNLLFIGSRKWLQRLPTLKQFLNKTVIIFLRSFRWRQGCAVNFCTALVEYYQPYEHKGFLHFISMLSAVRCCRSSLFYFRFIPSSQLTAVLLLCFSSLAVNLRFRVSNADLP